MSSVHSWDLIKSQDKIKEIYFSTNKYLSFNFQQYIKNKYSIDDKNIYHDQRILLLLYSLEWFKINENNYNLKIENHPLLLNKDFYLYKEIQKKYKRTQIFLSCTLSWIGLMIFFNNYKGNFRKMFIYSSIIFSVGYYSFGKYSAKKIYSLILNDNNLNKYFKLDIDLNLIKKELECKGINVEI